MSSNPVNRAHIRIPIESIIRQRKTYPRPPPEFFEEDPPEPDFAENGERLLKELDECVNYCKRKEKIDCKENFFFIVETIKQIDKEEHVFNKQYTFSLQTGPCSAIVSANEQKLSILKEKLERYSANSKYKTWINEIKRISKVKIDRINEDLIEHLREDKPIPGEIELLPNLGEEYNQFMIKSIKKFLTEKEEEVIDTLIDDEMAALRAVVRPQTIKAVVQGFDSVWQTRKAPFLHIDSPQSIKLDQLPAVDNAPIDAKTICLLDTGVDIGNPLLTNLVTESYDFTPDKEIIDFNGHGTFDAGLAIFGDLEELDKRRSIDATALLINAKVQSKERRYNIGFIEKRIKEAVEKYHKVARIFSLSIMPEVCASFKNPSQLAHTIDCLSKEHDILFIVSSGNVKYELKDLAKKDRYPNYLQNDCCIVFWGAEACTAITVGGIALKTNNRAVAKKHQPSPFTRRGEFLGRGKPDVVASGGNIEIDEATRTLGENDPELGISSLGLSKEPVAFSKGTSCSAPIVANIVARLLKEYPHASPDLLKALLIHSSYVPDAHYALVIDHRLKKSLYGKGTPSFEGSAFCCNNAPTFIVEDSVKLDETASIPIYIPKIMKRIAGLRKVKVTLVYNPPVDTGVSNYALVDLDFQLHKQIRPGEFQVQRSNWDEEFRVKWDNVKCGTFSWEHSGWGLEWLLRITPDARCRNRFKSKDYEQKYAVVITIEDPTKKMNLYDAMFPLEKTLKKISIPTKKVKKGIQQQLFPEIVTK